MVSARVSRPRSSANKVQLNLLCGCFHIYRITLHLFHKTGYTIVKVFRGVPNKAQSIDFSSIVFEARIFGMGGFGG